MKLNNEQLRQVSIDRMRLAIRLVEQNNLGAARTEVLAAYVAITGSTQVTKLVKAVTNEY